MGMYFTPEERKEKICCSMIEAVREFGSSLFCASEVEKLNLEALANLKNIPLSFFYINVGLDQAIRDLKRDFPDATFKLKDFSKTEEK
jgi:hypothetical protein